MMSKLFKGFFALFVVSSGHCSNPPTSSKKSAPTCLIAMGTQAGAVSPAQRLSTALRLSGEERTRLLSNVWEAQNRIAQIAPEQRPEFFKKQLELVKHHFTQDEFAMLTYHLAKTTSNEFNRYYNQQNTHQAFKSARKKIIELDLDPILLLGVSTRLTQREIEVINMRVLDELSFKQISEAIANHDLNAEGRLGVSPQQAAAIYKNAIRKLERSLMNVEPE